MTSKGHCQWQIKEVDISVMRHHLLLISASGLALMVIGFLLTKPQGWEGAHRPQHVQLATASGVNLPNFFDGLKPNSILKKRIHSGTPRREQSCGQKEGIMSRIGAVMGIPLTVHAQGNCYSTECGDLECSETTYTMTCNGGACPSGDIYYTMNSEFQDDTIYYDGHFACHAESGCACEIKSCLNPKCSE